MKPRQGQSPITRSDGPLQMTSYAALLQQVKSRIREAQTRAVQSVNAHLIGMYWEIGRLLVERQAAEGWGAGVLRRLAGDLRNELPEVNGFSERNLKLMTQFYRQYPGLSAIGQPPVAQLPAPPEPPSVRHQKRLVAEYALKGVEKAIGVSQYRLTRSLPRQLRSSLPTIAQIEQELSAKTPTRRPRKKRGQE